MTWETTDGGQPSTHPAPSGADERLSAGAERRVSTPPAVTRVHLLRVIREQNFDLTTEQLTILAATRGSRMGSVTLSPARIPVGLTINVDPDGAGTRVLVGLTDRWPGRVGRNWGATSIYVEVFAEVLGAVDAALARLDPGAASAFAPWWRSTGPGDVPVMQSVTATAARAGAAVGRQASRLLDSGSTSAPTGAAGRVGDSMFVFVAPDGVATLDAGAVDGLLTAGLLIVSRPGDMPPPLVAQVQELVVRVEEYLATRVGANAPQLRLELTAGEVPVLTFLRQQSRLREELPLRTLRICTTCRWEKVVNPDLERLQERSRRTKALAGSVGAVFGSLHASPYVLAGRLVQMQKLEPDFACPRCQGLDADDTLITFCQRCGDRRAETALRECAACHFDFRTLLSAETLWQVTAPATVTAPAAPTVTASPSGTTPSRPALSPPDSSEQWPRPPG